MIDNLTLVNKQTGYTLKMDMYNATYLLYEGGIDWGSASVEHNTYDFSSMIGKYVANTVVGSRDISIAGWIVGKSDAEIYTKKEILISVVNPLQDIRIEYGDWGIDAKASTNINFSNTYQENNDRMCKFLIQLFCPFPMFTKNDEVVITMTDIISSFHFPWVLTDNYVMSYYDNIRIKQINNDGMISTGLKVVMIANGTVNNPTVISITNQEKMSINKTMEAGEQITISSQNKRYVEGIKDGVIENYLDYFDYDNVWMQLNQGVNELTIKTYDNNGIEDETYKNLTVYLYYNPCTFNLKEE
jgi:hypothetical protein